MMLILTNILLTTMILSPIIVVLVMLAIEAFGDH